MLMKPTFPYLWSYVSAAIDESCAPGQAYLDALGVDDVELAALAEAELRASGMTQAEIHQYAYDGPDEATLISPNTEYYIGRFIL